MQCLHKMNISNCITSHKVERITSTLCPPVANKQLVDCNQFWFAHLQSDSTTAISWQLALTEVGLHCTTTLHHIINWSTLSLISGMK